MLRTFWRHWCKALGTKAYEDNKQSDYVAIIRTFYVLLVTVTSIMIILGNAHNLGWI